MAGQAVIAKELCVGGGLVWVGDRFGCYILCDPHMPRGMILQQKLTNVLSGWLPPSGQVLFGAFRAGWRDGHFCEAEKSRHVAPRGKSAVTKRPILLFGGREGKRERRKKGGGTGREVGRGREWDSNPQQILSTGPLAECSLAKVNCAADFLERSWKRVNCFRLLREGGLSPGAKQCGNRPGWKLAHRGKKETYCFWMRDLRNLDLDLQR